MFVYTTQRYPTFRAAQLVVQPSVGNYSSVWRGWILYLRYGERHKSLMDDDDRVYCEAVLIKLVLNGRDDFAMVDM